MKKSKILLIWVILSALVFVTYGSTKNQYKKQPPIKIKNTPTVAITTYIDRFREKHEATLNRIMRMSKTSHTPTRCNCGDILQ